MSIPNSVRSHKPGKSNWASQLLSKLSLDVVAAVVAAALFGVAGLAWALFRSNGVDVVLPVEGRTVFREGERYELTYTGSEELFAVWEDPAGDIYPRGQVMLVDGAATGSLGVIGGCFDFHNGATFVLRIVGIEGQISSSERSYLRLDDLEKVGPLSQEGFQSLQNHLVPQAEVAVVRESC